VVVDNGTFQRFRWLFFSGNIRDYRLALLHSDTQRMTLSDLELPFRVKFCFRAGLAGLNRATFEK